MCFSFVIGEEHMLVFFRKAHVTHAKRRKLHLNLPKNGLKHVKYNVNTIRHYKKFKMVVHPKLNLFGLFNVHINCSWSYWDNYICNLFICQCSVCLVYKQ